jgi:1-deoxy-D-xylulose-5-phosphate synthase
MVHPSLAAAEQLDATVANMRFIKPLDVELLTQLALQHDYLVTVEEGAIMGGAGAAVAEALAAAGLVKPLLMLGLPDKFIDHGDSVALLKGVGLDGFGICASIRARFASDAPLLKAIV